MTMLETATASTCALTTELSGRPPPLCRGQTRPTMPHGPLERVVSCHAWTDTSPGTAGDSPEAQISR
jgi:hypothetical protein